jgi:hypothetical protein
MCCGWFEPGLRLQQARMPYGKGLQQALPMFVSDTMKFN